MCEAAAPIRKVSDIMNELHEHETGEQLHNEFVFQVIVFFVYNFRNSRTSHN